MRVLRILLVLAGIAVGAAASAQTNWNSKLETRKLALQEVLELTIKNNLDLQIDRYNPQIALFNVQAAYSGYDPTFSFGGQHDHTESGTRLLAGGFTIPGSQSDDNTFSAGISGVSPIGTTYSVQ